MNTIIRNIEAADLPAVIALMKEFAAYEKLTEYCTVTEERLASTMFGPDAFVEGLIALDDDGPSAYALFYPSFSSFRGERGLYLEDIYVQARLRRSGLGLRMLNEIAQSATLRGFERIDFQVLEWNQPAVEFYLNHGAVIDDDERHFKFTGEAFSKLSGSRLP